MSNKTKQKKRIWPSFSYVNLLLYIFFLVVPAIFYILGRSDAPRLDKSKESIEYTNFYTNGMHYIVFESVDGPVYAVNYTLDSLRKESFVPSTITIIP